LRLLLLVLGSVAMPVVARAQRAGAAADAEIITLVVGEQKVIKIPGLSRVAIGDPNVADVKPVGSSQILVTGVGGGRTSLLAWKDSGERLSYTVRVTAQDPGSLMADVQRLLGDREGISVRVIGDKVYLDGFAFTNEDYERVQQITALYKDVRSFVKLNPNAKQLVANQLNTTLQSAGLKDAQATVVGTTVFLEGSVESPEELKKAELITKAIGEQVENLLTVGIKRMILTEVDFVEIQRTGNDFVGFNWPTDITGGAEAAYSDTVTLVGQSPDSRQITFNVLGETKFRLGGSFNAGYARTLARPKLVCASGGEASFLAGGEIPIPMVTANTVAVEFKEFGVRLTIKPTSDSAGNIQSAIEAEVSAVDESLRIVTQDISVPGFKVNRAKTNVTVRHGETIVLSGLFNNVEQKSVAKMPLLGQIPILGELFKSRDFQDARSELVVFVTPRIVNPASEKIIRTIEEIKDRYQRAKDEVGFSIFD
jgi:pilus assembly protein CpaC